MDIFWNLMIRDLDFILKRYCVSYDDIFLWDTTVVLRIPWEQALERWRLFRRLARQTQHYPLILGDLTTFHAEQLSFTQNDHFDQQMERAQRLDIAHIILERLQTEIHSIPRGEYPPVMHIPPIREEHFFTLDRRLSKPSSDVFIGLFPTLVSHEIPIYLNFGGWSACPSPEEHLAFWKHWNKRYGAEAVVLTGDVLEMRVSRPPQDHKQAYELAFEQYTYCENIVSHGLETIDYLAAALLGSPNWYFWWI